LGIVNQTDRAEERPQVQLCSAHRASVRM